MAGIHWILDPRHYIQYLQLDKVLTAQKPLSGQQDEMLFIVIHQASELWIKLCLHELSATRAQIRADDLEPAFKMLSRVSRAQMQLIQSWDVLGTMTPADYSRFRDSLGQSSGFQSWQYPSSDSCLQQGLAADRITWKDSRRFSASRALDPSLYDESLRLPRGADSTSPRIHRADWTILISNAAVDAAGSRCIADSTAHWISRSRREAGDRTPLPAVALAHLKTVEPSRFKLGRAAELVGVSAARLGRGFSRLISPDFDLAVFSSNSRLPSDGFD